MMPKVYPTFADGYADPVIEAVAKQRRKGLWASVPLEGKFLTDMIGHASWQAVTVWRYRRG